MTDGRYERKLLSMLEENGWRYVRSPSSGSGRKADQPDAVVSKAGVLGPLGVEAKTSSKSARTVERAEADALCRWCDGFGATPVLAVYWKGPPGGNTSYGGWYFRRLGGVRESSHPNANGGYHLRPRRADRWEWAQIEDLNDGRLTPAGADQ